MKDGFDAAKKLIESCKMISLAVSLGTCDTLIGYSLNSAFADFRQSTLLP